MKNILSKYLKRFVSERTTTECGINYKDKLVNDELHRQWSTETSLKSEEEYDQQKGWDYILLHTQSDGETRGYAKRSLTRYAAVACIIGLVFTSIFLFLNPREIEVEKEIYVHSTGAQDEYKIVLSDGTTVKLGAQSKLIYPAQFDKEARTVILQGQAFFDVTDNKDHPFEVEVDDMKIKVLGTSFEVFEDRNRRFVETILLSGKVEVSHNQNQVEKKYELLPNEKLTLSLSDGLATKESADASNYCAWRNYNGLHFINEKIENIIPRLEKWYKCNIELDGLKTKELNFTFKVRNESIESIMKLLTRSADLSYTTQIDEEEHTMTYILKHR